MKKTHRILALTLVLALALGLCASSWAAEQTKWKADFDLTYNSKYVWRGILFVDDPVLQPSANFNYGGFTFNVWGNWETTDVNDYGEPHGSGKNKFTEVDLTAEYAFTLGDFSIPVGVIHYLFPNTGVDATTELYAGVSYSWIVSPSVTLYQDIDEAHGQYILAALDFSRDLHKFNDLISLSIGASAGVAYASSDYNDYYFGVDEAAFSDWNASLSLPVAIGKYVTVTPAVTYTALIDSKLKDTTEDDTNTYFGVSVTVSF